MKHARRDYNDIKALDLKIPENEPVFLLRAQDVTAAEVVEYWANLQKDSYLKEIALRHAKAMRSWPVKKWADCPDSEIPEDIQMDLGIGTTAALDEIAEELEANLVQASDEEDEESNMVEDDDEGEEEIEDNDDDDDTVEDDDDDEDDNILEEDEEDEDEN